MSEFATGVTTAGMGGQTVLYYAGNRRIRIGMR
jgi:hypothetical protein